MRKKFLAIFLLCTVALAGCSSEPDGDNQTETQMEPQEIQDWAGEIAGESEEGTELQRISVQFGENTVVYELNDSPAAASLCEQLPPRYLNLDRQLQEQS